METTDVIQKGNYLSAQMTVTNFNTTYSTIKSPEFVISGTMLFQVRLITAMVEHSYVYNNLLFVRFTKRRASNDLTYMIRFNSMELNIMGKKFTSDDGTWHLINENKKQQFTFDVTVEVLLQPSLSSFAGLYDDTELMDFELCGEDGSVRMHRAVLAAASPELRRMLSNEWRETTEGRVAYTSKATLEHLKDFLYRKVLPVLGLEQLLLLSSYYNMTDLERLCVDRLVSGIKPGNACDLIEFAAKNNAKLLLLAVLECVQNRGVSVTEIRGHLDMSE